MRNLKFGILFAGLALAVGGAVAVVGAQDRVEARRGRGSVMVLDGRGSQLGVMVSDVDAKDAAGVRIDEVNPDSPAESAGLKAGDVVVEFDGERVRSARQFTRLVQETPDGRTVKIGVMRNGQKQTLDATPEAGRMGWNLDIDGDQIRREIERGLREFRVEPPSPELRYDDRGPRRFEYRVPELVMPFMNPRARLGVSVQLLTRDLEAYFGVKNGVLVSSVVPDSAASKAGLKAGDVITSLNGRTVNAPGDLIRELDDATGDVTIVVMRDKKEVTLKATLESRERPRSGSRPGIVI